MYRAWWLIILMFVGSLVGFLEWIADSWRYHEFNTAGRPAMAAKVAKSQKPGRTIVYLEETRFEYPIRFTTESGQDISTVAYVPQRFLDEVERDGAAPVIYLKDEPRRLIFPGDLERMPKHYGALLFCAACFIVALGLIKIRYRLAGAFGARLEAE
jgi:hypothetical protein